MANLRIIDFSNKFFECGGRKFFLHDSLSFNRYRELQKIIIEFGYSATFADLFKNLRIVWDYLNGLKLAEASVVVHNMMSGIKSLDEKRDPALRICALFINEEGEDPTLYDESKMDEKIDCWGRELDISPFFQLAASVVPSWIDAYKIVLNDGLKEAKKESSASKTK